MVTSGELRHPIVIRHVTGVTVTEMGAEQETTEEVKLFAKVEALGANETTKLGFKLNEVTYRISIRVAGVGKVKQIQFRNDWLDVKGIFSDDLNRFYTIIAVKK